MADLLLDVNDLVPLESADGEWGLEDYVVEVQATADQESYYECLHYQTIDSALREDDELVIRSLRTEDLRSRRLGGRHQISADGRHLIDGVAFGRQWLLKGSRPAINIPPRKRRRLEIEGEDGELDEESTTLLEQIKELGYGNEEDEEEDDDDDFVDEANDEDSDVLSDGDEDDEPMRIKAIAAFDNADVDEDEESEQDSEDDENEIMAGAGLELSDELKALLVEAEHLSENDTYHRLPSEAAQSPHKRKRKRDIEENHEAEDASDFEGFPTPTKPFEEPPSPASSAISLPVSDDTTVPSESDSDSDSDSDDAVDPTNTSSSGSSDSGDSSGVDTSDSDSDEESSSGESSSDSSSEGTTKLKEMKLPSSSPAEQAPSQEHSTSSSSTSTSSASLPDKRVQAAPGEGLKTTQRNNLRAHKRLRLARLKQEGLLPPNANFADMAALEEQTNVEAAAEGEVQINLQDDFESKKMALIQQLHIDNETTEETTFEAPRLFGNIAPFVGAVGQEQAINREDVTVEKDGADVQLELDMNASPSAKDNEVNNNTTIGDVMEVDESVPSEKIGVKAQESFIAKATPNSTGKRAKLDLASSRRMLFNSLGLRTPQTQEAEQALRERLAKDIKRKPPRKSEESINEESRLEGEADNDMDSWKDRIVLSAVECEYEGINLSTPPFPFKQGWDSNANMRRGANKKKGRKQSKYYDDGNDYVSQYAPDVSDLQDQSHGVPSEQDGRPESRTLSLEEQVADDMPRPSEFRELINLSASDLAPGAVIAFKELDIQNFQPIVSEYRVARVREVQTDGSSEDIELMLSKKDWPVACIKSDPFALEDEDKQPEDGIRIKKFADLIEPKLIEVSSVQVSAIPAHFAVKTVPNDNPAGLPQPQSSLMPEFEEVAQDSIETAQHRPKVLKMTHVEVNTPRRNQITALIKEAGFDSAIDKELLQPEVELESEAQSSPAFHTRSHRSQRSSHSPVPIDTHASATSVNGPRFVSPGLNGWDSSPLREVKADYSLTGHSRTSRQPTPDKPKPETQSSMSYPALTQLEVDTSGVTVTNDSSFQDAQQVSQPADIDTSAMRPDLDTSRLHPEYPYDDYGNDETQPSLASEVLQTQSPLLSSQAQAPAQTASNSFLGHGFDGPASLEDESDSASDTSSLPSLRELTSSQKHKIEHASRRARVSPPATRAAKVSISPPPARGKRLRNGKKQSASPEQNESDDSVELPPVKMSQSQVPRMSQIPLGSQIVDLTFSSSPAGPEGDGEYQAPRTRGVKSKKTTKAQASRDQSSRSISFDDDEEDAGAGLGKKRFLTTKRWRSHV